MDFSSHLENAAWVDWKASSEEALSALRYQYGGTFPALADPGLDALAENYAAEETLDHLKALGQELTCFGCRLYYVGAGADAYPLILIPEGEAADFESWCKGRRKKAWPLAQPRRKPGTPAKRLDLGARLPCELCRLPEGWRTMYADMADDALWVNSWADPERFLCGRLRLDQQPPRLEQVPLLVRRPVRRADGLWAVMLSQPEREEQGGRRVLKDKTSRLCVGTDLADMERWRVLDARETGNDWNQLFWFGEDLFLANHTQAAVIREAGEGGSVQTLLEGKPQTTADFPRYFVRRGGLYLYFQRRVYRWQEKKLLRKAGFTPIYTISHETAANMVPVGETEAAFVDRHISVPRSQTEQEITILDVETGKTRGLTSRKGELCIWQRRLCVTPHNVRRGEPVLQCFDLTTGETRELTFGALRKNEVYGIHSLSDGRTVLETGDTLCFTDCLWEFMKPT